jgi:hypothetical protein
MPFSRFNSNLTKPENLDKFLVAFLPDLFEMIDDFRTKPLDPIKASTLTMEAWYPYYEKPLSATILDMFKISGMAELVANAFQSDDPEEYIKQQKSPPIPHLSKIPTTISPKIIPSLIAIAKTFDSILYNKAPLHNLIAQIRLNGDFDGSITRKILSVDRTAIHCSVIQKKIQQAELVKNTKFLNNIANAMYISKNPKECYRYPKLLFAVFLLLDLQQYQIMSEEERYNLLCNYYPKDLSPRSFHQECNRIKNSLTTQKR